MPSAKTPTPDLAENLHELGLRGLAAQLDDFLARATKQRLGSVRLLEELVRVESIDRQRRSLESRWRRSRIGSFKPMADFDWSWPRAIPRDLVERALALEFLDEGANVILVGAHGLGKTMLLKNIAHQAVLRGSTVLFVTAARLMSDLSAQDSPRALERRLKHYTAFGVLCIDELGYLAYDARATDLLFEVVTRRHAASKPIVLSTNLAFKDWPDVLPNATCTVALVDRLTHRADIIHIKGDSWRQKESKERQKRRQQSHGDDS